MKSLELLLVGGLGVGVLFLFMPASQRPRPIHWLPAANLIILGLHLILEGYRWQMVPGYILSVLLFFFTLSNLRYVRYPWLYWQMEDDPLLRTVGAVLSALILVDVLFLLWIAPLFKLPEPVGKYAIGTRYYYFIDTRRDETFTPQVEDHRIISAQVWYPAEIPANPEGKPQAYLEAARMASPAFASFLGVPSFSYSHLSHIRTHAYHDAKLVSDSFPVLIFSHAYDGNITQNTILMEQLASSGYIVFSVGHPYETPFVFDQEGNPILFDADNPGRLARQKEIDDLIAGQIRSMIFTSQTLNWERNLYRRLFTRTPRLQESVRIWAEDIASLINQLEDLNTSDPFFGRLDLESIGVFGHSLGGAAAGQFCLVDVRCQAGLNMDGFQYGDLLETNLKVPFMFMYSALPNPDESRVNQYFYEQVENDAYSLVIEGTNHQSFSDLPFYFEDFRVEQRLEGIDPGRAAGIINAYTLAFFDRYLKGIDSPLLSGESAKYPEVILESRVEQVQ